LNTRGPPKKMEKIKIKVTEEVRVRKSWGDLNPGSRVMRDRRKRRKSRSSEKSKLKRGIY
jgi:hypothetical protein